MTPRELMGRRKTARALEALDTAAGWAQLVRDGIEESEVRGLLRTARQFLRPPPGA